MKQNDNRPRGFITAVAILAAVFALLLLTGEPGYTDDRDLLRKNTAKPYVMLILDTSGSMNLELADTTWLPLGGDDPRSRIHNAKRALYDVFKTQTNVNYGFMTFDQDGLRVHAKHWLYAPTVEAIWPLDYPVIPSGAGADGTDDSFTLGKHVGPTIAGSCTDPLDLDNAAERAAANRFPKIGEDGSSSTLLWVEQSNTTYLLEVSAPNIASESLGDSPLTLKLVAAEVSECFGLISSGGDDDGDPVFGPIFGPKYEATIPFRLVGQHLMSDAGNRLEDDGAEGGGNDVEDHAGFWNWHDAEAVTTCSDKAPFSGKGLESNYDDPALAPPSTPAAFPDTLESFLTSADEYCGGSVCDDLKQRTSLDPVLTQYRELDRGDFIPYHWDIASHQEVLKRLNPNHGSPLAPDFGTSAFFTDTSAGTGTGYLALRDSTKRPLIATGETPFGKAVNDFRCWYLGPNIGPAGKCKDKASDTIPFEDGWLTIAENNDPDFECRRPYAILITDGEDTCAGEDPTADVNDWDRQGVKTWVINLGGKAGAQRLNSIIRTSKAPITTIGKDDPDELGRELRRILGEIESEARAFAAAAVPSVQTEDEQKIFLTAFNALNATSVWAGKAEAFLKPLPTKQVTDSQGVTQNVPDTSKVCTATDEERCFLWDAGEVLKTQVNAVPFGAGEDQRRVFYPAAPSGSSVPMTRRAFQGSTKTGVGDAVERDFWRGLGVPYTEGVVTSEEDARDEANAVVDYTYSLKSALLDPADSSSTIEYILGDNFHADPVIVAAPSSNQLFVQDYEDYRDFALKHRFRRKMIIIGTNDGMLHFFDAGIPRRTTSGGKVSVDYDRGTGRELIAHIPRSVLPTVAGLRTGAERPWSVDGSPTVADVYIDPKHAGTPNAGNREWRTVLIAGLRRGAESVYALDVTQPDKLKEVTVTEPVPDTVLAPDVADGASLVSCWNSLGDGDKGCDEDVYFGQPLWEFDDTVEIDGQRVRLDEDDNNQADFAQSWSKPNIGRIQVEEDGSVVDKFVAMFGGGFDPEQRNLRGNWFYIVDIETGKTIFKRQLAGSAASEPAAVDTNQDGLLDRVYIPTTAGYLYRLDLGEDSSGDLPLLEDYSLFVQVGGVLKAVPGEKRISNRIPFVVFDNINTTTGIRLPMFFRPSVIFTPLLSPNYALALGDGDRDNLWSKANTPGRFYLFVDDTDLLGGPITVADLEPIASTASNTAGDFLFEPASGKRNGWYIILNENERVVSNAFSLSGIITFSTFQPEIESTVDPENRRLRLCSRRGDSRAFGVLATNANGVLFDQSSNRTRSLTVNTLISKTFADLATSQGEPPSGGGTEPPPPTLPPNMQLIMDELKKLFPSNCRFASYRIDIRAVAADTEIVEVAPVPVCLIEKNWREF